MTPKERAAHHRWEISQRRKRKIYQPNRQLPGSKMVYAPEILDIYGADNTESTLTFIHQLQDYQSNAITNFTLNFRNCRILKAAALVIIFSILERLVVDYQKQIKLIFPILRQAPSALKVLRKSGILELCKNRVAINRFDEDYLPIVSSSGGKYREEIIDFIVKKIYQEMPPDLENIYADAIQEAINNVTAHAYLGEKESFLKRWWLLCEVIGNQLFLVIYDAGIGIPKSLEVHLNKQELDLLQSENILALQECYEKLPEFKLKYQSFEDLHRRLKTFEFPDSFPDYLKIYLAMIGDITRKTGRDELKHGQGSKSIKALVSSNEEGTLWIFSGSGRVKFINEVEIPTLTHLPKDIKGTLIQWNIRITK